MSREFEPQDRTTMAIKEQDPSPPSLSLPDDALFCEEEQWEDDDDEEQQEQSGVYNYHNNSSSCNNNGKKTCFFPLLVVLLEQDLFWEDEELMSLLSREKQLERAHVSALQRKTDHGSSDVSGARREAVEWMLKVNAHYGFTTLTAVLAINYLDRFLCSVQFQRDKPWMVQLVAVTCLSLAAKVEETQVPLLLDLQVEGTKYVFEAKTIQKMELLVLTTLQWKMHPVTPLSFLDHIIRRLGLKTHLHWEFLRRCERLLLSAVSDLRFVGYLPSVVAAATMMHVIEDVEPCNAVAYQDQLLDVLKMSKEKVNGCYELISELSENSVVNTDVMTNPRKRKSHEQIPSSPSGVIDAWFSSDCSSDSWSSAETEHALFKKMKKTQQQEHKCLTSINRVFVESPR